MMRSITLGAWITCACALKQNCRLMRRLMSRIWFLECKVWNARGEREEVVERVWDIGILRCGDWEEEGTFR